MFQADKQDWESFFIWALSTEQKEWDAQVEDYENQLAQNEIDDWENREQYGVEW